MELDHPPPTSVSPSTKVEEVQEKGAVQNHPSWRVKRVHKSEEMEEGEEVQEKGEEQEKVEVQDHPPYDGGSEQEKGEEMKEGRLKRWKSGGKVPSQSKRNKFKRQIDELLARCYEEEARTGIEQTADLVEVYKLKVKVHELGW